MSDSPNPETDVEVGDQPSAETNANPEHEAAEESSEGLDVQAPDYQEMKDETVAGGSAEISRFHDLKVSLTAELGKTTVPLEQLLQLGPGSVVELDRAIDSPVELMAQGVPVACGDVVVVDDRFAIRINEVYASHPGQ